MSVNDFTVDYGAVGERARGGVCWHVSPCGHLPAAVDSQFVRASPNPRAAPPGTPSSGAACKESSLAESTARPSVLVVDDEEPIRNALKKFLAQQQFETYAAASGEEALNQLRRHKIALMLCDIRMPGTSGVDLVPQALEIEPDLAILMLTAVNDATSAALCMQRGAMDYLTKPSSWRIWVGRCNARSNSATPPLKAMR